MGMKFQMSNTVAKKASAAPKLYTAALVVMDAYEDLVVAGAKVDELSECVDNIMGVSKSVSKHGLEGLAVLGTMSEGSLEAFLGCEAMADAKIASASLEGKFSEAVKNVWKAIKEWFAKFYDWFRKMFFSLEADLKHLEGMVDPSNDAKFNPETKYEDPVPTKQAMHALLRAANVVNEQSQEYIAQTIRLYEHIANLNVDHIQARTLAAMGKQLDKASEQQGLNKVDAEFVKEKKNLDAKLKAAFDADPLLKQFHDDVDNIRQISDPIKALQLINSGFIRSGTAAELGYKSANDIRDVITEFAKVLRASVKLESSYKQMTTALAKIVDKYGNLATQVDVPPDFVRLARQYQSLLGKLPALNGKICRWILMYVTRAVRRMYSK